MFKAFIYALLLTLLLTALSIPYSDLNYYHSMEYRNQVRQNNNCLRYALEDLDSWYTVLTCND